jgi:hypothetical protein
MLTLIHSIVHSPFGGQKKAASFLGLLVNAGNHLRSHTLSVQYHPRHAPRHAGTGGAGEESLPLLLLERRRIQNMQEF